MQFNKRYVFKYGNKLILKWVGEELLLPEEVPQGVEICGDSFRVRSFGLEYEGMNINEPELTSGYIMDTLREAYRTISEADYKAAGKLMELLHWDKMSQFCGCCSARMKRSTEISKRCPKCGYEYFAAISPAIIVLVTRGETALLVHARNFTRPNYGLVAGFVETGESLEECVRREVREETSLEVENIRYIGSQPWPYPNSLMLGFTAEYVSGEVCFADGELTSGGFFSKDNLPPLPPHPSIARKLVDAWIERKI